MNIEALCMQLTMLAAGVLAFLLIIKTSEEPSERKRIIKRKRIKMAREGLMDDSGHNCDPSPSEEMAWENGYENAIDDSVKKIERLIDKNKSDYDSGYIPYQMYLSRETSYITCIEEIRKGE